MPQLKTLKFAAFAVLLYQAPVVQFLRADSYSPFLPAERLKNPMLEEVRTTWTLANESIQLDPGARNPAAVAIVHPDQATAPTPEDKLKWLLNPFATPVREAVLKLRKTTSGDYSWLLEHTGFSPSYDRILVGHLAPARVRIFPSASHPRQAGSRRRGATLLSSYRKWILRRLPPRMLEFFRLQFY